MLAKLTKTYTLALTFYQNRDGDENEILDITQGILWKDTRYTASTSSSSRPKIRDRRSAQELLTIGRTVLLSIREGFTLIGTFQKPKHDFANQLLDTPKKIHGILN